jgi:hypothetical protein
MKSLLNVLDLNPGQDKKQTCLLQMFIVLLFNVISFLLCIWSCFKEALLAKSEKGHKDLA